MAAAVAQHAAERKLFVAEELAAANGPIATVDVTAKSTSSGAALAMSAAFSKTMDRMGMLSTPRAAKPSFRVVLQTRRLSRTTLTVRNCL
jgi:hypothetical protein